MPVIVKRYVKDEVPEAPEAWNDRITRGPPPVTQPSGKPMGIRCPSLWHPLVEEDGSRSLQRQSTSSCQRRDMSLGPFDK